jgi:hypothetical protein
MLFPLFFHLFSQRKTRSLQLGVGQDGGDSQLLAKSGKAAEEASRYVPRRDFSVRPGVQPRKAGL